MIRYSIGVACLLTTLAVAQNEPRTVHRIGEDGEVITEPAPAGYFSLVKISSTLANGEERVGSGVYLGDGLFVTLWLLIDGASEVTATLACCDAIELSGVVVDDGEFGLVLLRGEVEDPPEPVETRRSQVELGEILTIKTPGPIRLEGHVSTVTFDGLALGVIERAGEGPLIRVDVQSNLIRYGSPVMDAQSRLVGLVHEAESNGRTGVKPIRELLQLPREQLLSFAAYDELQQEDAGVLAHRHVQRAREMRSNGDVNGAAGEAKAAISLEPRSWLALYELGVCQDLLGETEQAIETLSRSVEIEANFDESRYSLGLVFMKTGREAESIAHFEAAQRLSPDYPKPIAMHGVALLRMGEFERALESMRRSIEAAPDSMQFHVNLAIALGRTGRSDEVIGVWQHAVEENPESAQAAATLGKELMDAERMGEAIPHLRRAVELGTEDEYAAVRLVVSLGMLDQYEEAYEIVNAMLKQSPEHPMVLQLKDLLDKESGGG